MQRNVFLVIILWFLLFLARITQIGGIDPTYTEPPNLLLKPLQESFTKNLDQLLPYPQSVLLSGILLGSQGNLPFFLKKELQATSTIHIVVVSGQNLTMLAGFLMSLAPFIGRKKTIILTLGAIVFYSVLTGLGIPVIRAAIMVSLVFLAKLMGKDGLDWWILLLTVGVMLLINPNWILSISFQLSVMATLGVVVMAPILLPFFKQVPNILREDLVVSLSAQILTLPFIAYNFGQISIIGVLVNGLVLWCISLVMISGFFTLAVSFLSTTLGQIIGLLPGVLLTYFIYIVEIFSKIPFGSVRVGESSLILWVGYYLLIGGLVWGLRIKINKPT